MEPLESYVPWQYKWQRPKLIEATRNEDESLLQGMVTIESKSARLTPAETRLILEKLNLAQSVRSERSGTDFWEKKNGNNMKWEDLESSSDEETNDCEELPHTKKQKIDGVQCILSVSILASKKSIECMEYVQKHGERDIDQTIVADCVYLEVVRDSTSTSDEIESDASNSIDDERKKETCEILYKRLLRWPSSTLTDIYSKERRNESIVSPNESLSMMWHSLIRTLNKKEDGSNEHQLKEKDKLHLNSKRLEERVGLLCCCLCRRQLNEEEDLSVDLPDYDDMNEIIKMMSFGAFEKLNSSPVYESRGDEKKVFSDFLLDIHSDQSELLLCCVTNDGKVNIYSALDLLLIDNTMNGFDNVPNINVFDHLKVDDKDDVFSFGFERLLFGAEIQNRLHEDVLPLCSPKNSISISSLLPKELYLGDHAHHSLLDFSLLDSNIDTRTIHDRTIGNIPTICISTDEYIVIGGVGHKMYGKSYEPSVDVHTLNDEIRCTEKKQSKQELNSGGFITFISIKYQTESKTIFVPFIPLRLSYMEWNGMKLIIVMGGDKNQCMAIRTDSTTSIILRRNNTFQQSDHSQIFQQVLPVQKFSMMKLTIYDHSGEICADRGTCPLSIVNLSANPGLVCYTIDDVAVNLTLHQITGLRINDDIKESNMQNLVEKLSFQKETISVECQDDFHHSVRIGFDEFDDTTSGCKLNTRKRHGNINVISCLSGKVRIYYFTEIMVFLL